MGSINELVGMLNKKNYPSCLRALFKGSVGSVVITYFNPKQHTDQLNQDSANWSGHVSPLDYSRGGSRNLPGSQVTQKTSYNDTCCWWREAIKGKAAMATQPPAKCLNKGHNNKPDVKRWTHQHDKHLVLQDYHFLQKKSVAKELNLKTCKLSHAQKLHVKGQETQNNSISRPPLPLKIME